MNLYLYEGKYFATGVCLDDKKAYIYITDDGVDLTDNWMLPYTPKNLWSEIWKENKIFFTGIYGIIIAALGVGVTSIIVGLIKVMQWLVSTV